MNRPLRLSLLYIAVAVLALGWTGQFGYYADEYGYVAPITRYFSEHLTQPFNPENDPGHPMIYAWLVALVWRVFGESRWVGYGLVWCCAGLAMAAVHLLTVRLTGGDRPEAERPWWIGPAAAVCLLVTPLFLGYAVQYLDAVPFLAFNLWMIVAWQAGRRGWVAVWALLLAMTRMTGPLAVAGLALFDLMRAHFATRGQRLSGRERLTAIGVVAWPYAVALGVFGLYLGYKLWVLDLPLTSYPKSDVFVFTWPEVRQRIDWMLEATVDYPRLTSGVWWLVAAAGLVAAWARRGTQPGNGQAGFASPAMTYGALAASLLLPVLLYMVHWYFPQPRALLGFHALAIVAGLHGLAVLVRGRGTRAVALTLIVIWCGLAALRWHGRWWKEVTGLDGSRWVMESVYSLDVLDIKRLYAELADYFGAMPGRPAIITTWSTVVFGMPDAAYTNKPLDTLGINWILSMQDPLEFMREHPVYRQFYVAHSSIDLASDQQLLKDLLARSHFDLVRTFAIDDNTWVRVYVWRK